MSKYQYQSAKVVSYSQPPREGEWLDNPKTLTDLIAFCARVSNPSNQSNTTTAPKLIAYLARNRHWSPFEMVNVCLEVTTTRDIARQFLRHRSFSFQEFSQRYADPTKDLNFVTREARLQDAKNRQNSIYLDLNDENQRELAAMWEEKQLEVIHLARETYSWAVTNGLAKEQARAVLPEGLTMSKMYVNGSIRSWLHYTDVRTEEGVQLEHLDLSNICAVEIARVFPEIVSYNHALK